MYGVYCGKETYFHLPGSMKFFFLSFHYKKCDQTVLLYNHLISNHQHIAKLMQNICTDLSRSIVVPSILFPSKSLGFLKHIFLEHKSSNAASPALNL